MTTLVYNGDTFAEVTEIKSFCSILRILLKKGTTLLVIIKRPMIPRSKTSRSVFRPIAPQPKKALFLKVKINRAPAE